MIHFSIIFKTIWNKQYKWVHFQNHSTCILNYHHDPNHYLPIIYLKNANTNVEQSPNPIPKTSFNPSTWTLMGRWDEQGCWFKQWQLLKRERNNTNYNNDKLYDITKVRSSIKMLSHTDMHIRLRNKSCQFERRGEGGCQERMLSKHTRKLNSVSQTEDKGCWKRKHQNVLSLEDMNIHRHLRRTVTQL